MKAGRQLTYAQMQEIRRRLSAGGLPRGWAKAFATEFGVRSDTMYKILKRLGPLTLKGTSEDHVTVSQQALPSLHSRDQMEKTIEDLVLLPLREECVMAFHGLGAQVGAVVGKTEAQLNEMTKCPAFPEGLDFSTDAGSGRFLLYKLREDIQRVFGIYFIGMPLAGLKFTAHPLVGMQWREQEFDDKARAGAQQLSRMWMRALVALGDNAPDRLSCIQPLSDERATIIERVSGAIQSTLVVSPLNQPKRPRKGAA